MALKLQAATRGAVSVADWPKLAEVANAVHGLKRGDTGAIRQAPLSESGTP